MVKKGKVPPNIILIFDIIGFILLILGGALIRYANVEPIVIIGGFVIAVGITILGLTRWIK